MFFFNSEIGTYAKIWSLEVGEKYDNLRISTSEKDARDPEDVKYINSNWFARAIGHAHQQIANGEVSEGDRIKITKAKISNEPYEKDGQKRSALRVTILEFETVGDGNNAPAKKSSRAAAKTTSKSKTKAKTKSDDFAETNDEDLPF